MAGSGIRRTRASLLTLTAMALVIGMAIPAWSASKGGGGGAPGVFQTSISPSSVTAGTTVDFSLTLTNNSTDTTIGSVNVKSPFTLISASTPSGTASVASGNVAQYRSLGLAPGTSVVVGLRGTVACVAGRYKFASTAKQSATFSGTIFAVSSAGPVSVSGVCQIAFGTQPTDANVGETITGAAFDPSGPSITVLSLDGNGNPITTGTGTVSMAIGTNPTGGTLHGTLSRPFVSGVASFGDLSIDTHGIGYTLAATSGVATATSGSFTIADAGNSCSGDCTTTATASDGTAATITTQGSTTGGDVFLIFNVDTLDCPSYTETSAVLTFGSTGDGQKRIIMTVPPEVAAHKPDIAWQVCYGTDGGQTFTDVNGNQVTLGLLPDCGAVDEVPPCVISRQSHPDGSLSVIFRAPSGDPKGRL
jgi:hypothetical protein